jgi:prepilin-type N-terminal cleavage/methylation domain-containing protein
MTSRRCASGFTLIELLVAIIVMGIVAALVLSAVGGSAPDSARAETLYSTGANMARTWAMFAQTAGAPNAPGPLSGNNNVLLRAGSSVVDVLQMGEAEVASAYQTAWREAGLSPLHGALSGARGAQTLLGYPVAVYGDGSGGATPFAVQLSQVPDAVVLALVQKYGNRASALAAAGDSSHAVVRYGAAAGGVRTVTLVYYI